MHKVERETNYGPSVSFKRASLHARDIVSLKVLRFVLQEAIGILYTFANTDRGRRRLLSGRRYINYAI